MEKRSPLMVTHDFEDAGLRERASFIKVRIPTWPRLSTYQGSAGFIPTVVRYSAHRLRVGFSSGSN